MATKEQEREALKQIIQIVESVGGEDSYIGAAFEGCFTMAWWNIENDLGDSWKARCRFAQKQLEEAEKKLEKAEKESLQDAEIVAEAQYWEKRYDDMKRRLDRVFDSLDTF